MTEFTFATPLTARKKRDASVPGNIAYALFVLFCFWAGAQLLNMLVHAPGMFDSLLQAHTSPRPQVEMDLAVRTLFGLVPFLLGGLLLAALAYVMRWLRYF